ncbi:unknown [Bacteroides sp. CAG:144]|nr:unknown [Bacteroides sp. CAG:144]
MVGIYFWRNLRQIFISIHIFEKGRNLFIVFSYPFLQSGICIFPCIKINTSSQSRRQPTYLFYPLQETRFILGLGRNRNNNTPQCIDRHQKTRNHYLLIQVLQQRPRQIAEKRISCTIFTMHTDNDIGYTVLLGRMDNSADDIPIITNNLPQRNIDGCRNLRGFSQIVFSLHLSIRRIINVIDNTQCQQIFFLTGIPYRQ